MAGAQIAVLGNEPLIQKPFDVRALADLLDRIMPAAAVAPPAS
jgi:hypothetical protein